MPHLDPLFDLCRILDIFYFIHLAFFKGKCQVEAGPRFWWLGQGHLGENTSLVHELQGLKPYQQIYIGPQTTNTRPPNPWTLAKIKQCLCALDLCTIKQKLPQNFKPKWIKPLTLQYLIKIGCESDIHNFVKMKTHLLESLVRFYSLLCTCVLQLVISDIRLMN
jgi:hypothetical protein